MQTCFQCKRPFRGLGRFEIAHFGTDGKMQFRCRLCSLACVGKWVVNYGLLLAETGFQSILQRLRRAAPGSGAKRIESGKGKTS